MSPVREDLSFALQDRATVLSIGETLDLGFIVGAWQPGRLNGVAGQLTALEPVTSVLVLALSQWLLRPLPRDLLRPRRQCYREPRPSALPASARCVLNTLWRGRIPMTYRLFSWMTLFAVGAFLAAGCGNTTDAHGNEDAVADAAGDAVVAAEGVTATDAVAGNDTAAVTVPTTFTPACKADTDCTDGNCINGVCVLVPTEIGNLTDPANDYEPSTETLEVGCVDETFADQIKGLPTGKTVTAWGRVDRFGGGDITSNIEVDVFRIEDFHPEVCAGIADSDARDACFKDETKVGKPLAHTISLDADQAAIDAKIDVASPKKAKDVCATHFDCPNGYECQKSKADASKVCNKSHGVYALEGVPTNTRLVFRVRKHDPSADWHDSYYWDIVLFSDHLDPVGVGHQPTKYIGTDTYHVNPTIVGQGQWQLVPTTLGLGDIQDGNGVVGGRIRDCGNLKRGGFPIHDAKVGLGVPPSGLAFFNDNEDDTVPIKNKQSTDTLGRFAAVDLPPGANRVSASVMVGTQTIKLGSQDVFVVPGALMIVSLPGRIPVLTK